MNNRTNFNRPFRPIIVTFSGIDGAGKTTQIENLRDLASRFGLRSELITFWDNVVVGARYRESFVHKVYGSEKGIGSPENPVNRQDKNIRRWYLTGARYVLYLADAIHLRFVINRAQRMGSDVIILDRYIFDELANLPLHRWFAKFFVHQVRGIVHQPDVAYLLDADPKSARARKPEYPVDFMHKCRRSYFVLSSLLGYMTIIPPLPLTDAKHEVETAFLRLVNFRYVATSSLDSTPAA